MATKRVEQFEGLVCYKLSYALKCEVIAFTAKPPTSRDFKFCDQIRDSSRGAPRTISEGFGRYRPREYARFLSYAKSSLQETINHLRDARDSEYIDDRLFNRLNNLAHAALTATTNLMAAQHRLADRQDAENRRPKPRPKFPTRPSSKPPKKPSPTPPPPKPPDPEDPY